MKTIRTVLVWGLPLVIILAVTGQAPAQGAPSILVPESSIFAGVRIVPHVQIGYEKLALNFNLPAWSNILNWPNTLDLKFRDANLWVGSLGAALEFPSGLGLAIEGQANAKRNITVYEREEFEEGGLQGVKWNGSQLQCWALDGQVRYRLRNDCAIKLGLRRDHLTLNLGDPRTDNGQALSFDDSGLLFPPDPTNTFIRHQRYYSDLMSTLWVPHVGFEVVGPGYRGSLIGSPFASVEFQVPAALLFDLTLLTQIGPFPPIVVAEFLDSEGLLYRVNRPALFLEGNLQYDWTVLPTLTIGLWGKASWLSLKGEGQWSHNVREQTLPFPPFQGSEAQENTASYTRHVLGGGLSAVWSF
ncbi:MAG: hypothetical protein HY914_01575 [Desulfomonile tiedjei]|nr:hypothetical protein [Desulfomonile tiedjei]